MDEKVGELKDMVFKTINTYTNTKNTNYIIFSFIVVFFIFFALISWIYRTLSLKDDACKKLDIIYENNNFQTSTFRNIIGNGFKATKANNPKNYFDNIYESLIKNYYIKTAYNCCCGDGYKNNFVNICALEKCVYLGARCLDFEIYSYNGEPIVAASTANNNSIKETYNYLKLDEVFDILNTISFNNNFTQCVHDPMFLHFRIMSENKVIYDKFAKYIEENLNKNSDYLLNTQEFNYQLSKNDDILVEHIGNRKFSKKFIIMVNTLHCRVLNDSKLSKYVNIKSGSKTMKLLRYENVIAMGEKSPVLIDDSKTSLIMVLPNLNNDLKNYDPLLPLSSGCQFVAMKFQNLDNNLVGYFKQFRDYGGYSFILKPNNLRQDLFEPEVIEPGIALNTRHGARSLAITDQ